MYNPAMSARRLNRNVRLFYAYRLTKFAVFHVSVLVLFYQWRGLSFTQVMLLQTVYYIGKVLSEAPTGVVADRYGRRLSLILASLVHGLAYVTIFLGHSFWVFALGEALAGVGMSLASGADSALAYDSLLTEGRELEYRAVEGRAYGLRLLGYAAFAPIGSWLASMNLALPYLVSAGFMFASGLFAAAMIEPPRVMDDESGSYLGEMARSARLILRHRTVLWLTLFSALMFIATRIGFWTFQPFMERAGLSVAFFGLAFAAYSVFGAWVSSQADRVERRLRQRWTLILLPACVIVSFLGMSRWMTLAGLSFIFLQEISMGLYDPVLLSYTNQYVPSSIRATTLSFQSLAGNLAFAALSPFLGLFVDGLGLAWALRWFALIVAVMAAALLARRPASILSKESEAA